VVPAEFDEGGAMRNVIASGPSSRSGKIFLAAIVVVLSLSTVEAQKAAAPPKYDLQSETKIKGTVDEVKPPASGNVKDAVHLLVKTSADSLDVYLCPKSFLDAMGLSFSKGDELAITGSKVKVDGADLILTRELVKGNDTVSLRDAKGDPVWDWHR
jgi:hypothetical protein